MFPVLPRDIQAVACWATDTDGAERGQRIYIVSGPLLDRVCSGEVRLDRFGRNLDRWWRRSFGRRLSGRLTLLRAEEG
jgi:hypothetical protein